MPDLSKPPLHTLPHDELIAKLKTLTNLRVVRDPESATGWKIEVGPFPGWERCRNGGDWKWKEWNESDLRFWILDFGFPPTRPTGDTKCRHIL